MTVLAGCAATHARGGRASEPLDVRDVSLDELASMLSRATGRRVVVTGALRPVRATIVAEPSAAGARGPEATRVLLGILRQNGLTLIRGEEHDTLVEVHEAAREATPIYRDPQLPPDDDRFVTWLRHLAHLPASEAASLLERLQSPGGQLVPHDATGLLVVVDTGANIRRMHRILLEADASPRTGAAREADAARQVYVELRLVDLDGEGFDSRARAHAIPAQLIAAPHVLVREERETVIELGRAQGAADDLSVVLRAAVQEDGAVRVAIRAQYARAQANVPSVTQSELVVRDGETAWVGGASPWARQILVAVTPHVVDGPDDLRALFDRRARERQQQLQASAATVP